MGRRKSIQIDRDHAERGVGSKAVVVKLFNPAAAEGSERAGGGGRGSGVAEELVAHLTAVCNH